MPHSNTALRIAPARVVALVVAIVIALAFDSRADPAPAVADSPRADTLATPRPDGDGRASSNEGDFPIALGSFSTTLIGSSPERTANVRLAAAALDGVELKSGDELSFNLQVGPRTTARGYQMAPVILHETRQLQAGGGVCQVASTLFAAALLSGLSVVERTRHSSPVDYIALGEDATIAWGAKDLRIRNDLAQRVRLRVEVVGATLTVLVAGEEASPDSYELETEEREIPGDPGAGSEPGREIELYRVRRSGGDVASRDFVHRDVYPPSRRQESR
jgi:hypothetical protein